MRKILSVLTLVAALVPASAIAQGAINDGGTLRFGDWTVKIDSSTAHATTSSKNGGMLSFMCRPNKPKCQPALIAPDADCKPDSKSAAVIRGAHGALVVDTFCTSLPRIGTMPGAGRVIMFDPSNPLVPASFTTQDATIKIENSSGKTVQYSFSSNGARQAMDAAEMRIRPLPQQSGEALLTPSQRDELQKKLFPQCMEEARPIFLSTDESSLRKMCACTGQLLAQRLTQAELLPHNREQLLKVAHQSNIDCVAEHLIPESLKQQGNQQ